MKKKSQPIITFIALFILTFQLNGAFAQNYCNDIVKYSDNGLINFKTPMPAIFKNTGNDFILWKTISPKDSSTQMYLCASLTKQFADYSARGFKVELEDGTILNFADADLNCEYKPTLGYYLFHAIVPLKKADMEIFKTKRLKSYTMANRNVNSFLGNFKTKFFNYATCIDGFK